MWLYINNSVLSMEGPFQATADNIESYWCRVFFLYMHTKMRFNQLGIVKTNKDNQ